MNPGTNEMGLPRALARSILPSVVGLLIGCYVASLALVLIEHVASGTLDQASSALSGALIYSGYALIFAAPAALLIAWPAHAQLLRKGQANYLTVGYVPALICLVMLPSGAPWLVVVVAGYGLVIAWTTHWLQLLFDGWLNPGPTRAA